MKTSKTVAIAALSIALSGLFSGVSLAETITGNNPSDLLALVNSLETADAARQNIESQVHLQLAQVTEEVANLSHEPMNTVDEKEAFIAELGAIAAKLNDLSAAADALDQIQASENALFTTLQARTQALGIQ